MFNFNRGLWKELENYERVIATEEDSCYSTTGMIFDKITDFTISTYFYKIIFFYKEGKWQNECYLMENKNYLSGEKIDDFKINLDSIIRLNKGILKY